MEDRRCWKLLVAVCSPPRGHSKMAKATMMATRYGEAQPVRKGGQRPVRARASSGGEGGCYGEAIGFIAED